jgi:hypothetical protein
VAPRNGWIRFLAPIAFGCFSSITFPIIPSSGISSENQRQIASITSAQRSGVDKAGCLGEYGAEEERG